MLSSSRRQGNFQGPKASRPRPRTSKCVLEAKDVLEDSTSDGNDIATSTHCSRTISCQSSSISGLFRLLKSKRKLSLESDDRSLVRQLPTVMKQEMKFLEATGKRPRKLEPLVRALSNISPTSVEAERAFSAAGLFAPKLKERLGDKSVNALSFLRGHYMKQN